jgi:hypothetical protein
MHFRRLGGSPIWNRLVPLRLPPCPCFLGRDCNSRSASLGKPDGDCLLGVLGAVFALPHVMNLFADILSGLGARGVFAGSRWHEVSFLDPLSRGPQFSPGGIGRLPVLGHAQMLRTTSAPGIHSHRRKPVRGDQADARDRLKCCIRSGLCTSPGAHRREDLLQEGVPSVHLEDPRILKGLQALILRESRPAPGRG